MISLRSRISQTILLLMTGFCLSALQIIEPNPDTAVSLQSAGNLGSTEPVSLDVTLIQTGIFAWHDAGWRGEGRKIGVIDNGFGQLKAFENNTDISLITKQAIDVLSEDKINHGTNVVEVIHAVAPEAQVFVCQYSDFDEFTQCVDWMMISNVHIINHSAGVPAVPLDGTNEWSEQVHRVSAANILWVNSAGNFHKGYLRDTLSDTNTNGYHEFRGLGISEMITVEPIGHVQGRVMLSWEGTSSQPANAIDLQLEVIRNNDLLVSDSPQEGLHNHRALEIVRLDMSEPFQIRIANNSNIAETVPFLLFVEFAELPGASEIGSVIAPGESNHALTVGATRLMDIAPYSSRGVQTGLLKPDIVAPGEVILEDGRTFIGTSVSAPVVAGATALLWQANPQLRAAEIRLQLLDSAMDDSMNPGSDQVFGNGRLFMVALLPETPNLPQPVATQVVVTDTTSDVEAEPSTFCRVSTLSNRLDTDGSLRDVSVSRDGAYIAVGDRTGTAYIWENQSYEPETKLTGVDPFGSVNRIAFSPDGRLIATDAATDIQLWSVPDGQALQTLSGHQGAVIDLAFDDRGTRLYSADLEGKLIEWDLATEDSETLFELHSEIWEIDVQGSHLAAASENGILYVYDLENSVMLFELEHDGSVFSVAFHPSEPVVTTGTRFGDVYHWDLTTGHEIHRLEGHENGIVSLAYISSGSIYATGGYDITLRVWSYSDHSLIQELDTSVQPMSITFSPDNAFLLSGYEDHEGGATGLHIWPLIFGSGC